MGRYLDLCETVEVDAIEPTHPRDISDISDQSPPAAWTPQAWVDHFEERAAIIEHDGEQPRDAAERLALADTVNQWLVMHPPPATDDNDGCVHCRQPLGHDGVPVLAGAGHTWLHSACHHPWFAERRRHATEVLRAIGIEATGMME